MENREIYQKIYDKLERFFPEGWNKVVYYAEYGEGVYQMEFFVSVRDGEYIKCFDIPGVTMRELLNSFKIIDRYMQEARSNLSEKDKWTNLTVIMCSTGKFDAHFDYTDLSQNGYEYKEAWKKQYLV